MNPKLIFTHDHAEAHPPGENINKVKFPDVVALWSTSAKSHAIQFKEAGLYFIPVSKSPNFDLIFQESARLGTTDTLINPEFPFGRRQQNQVTINLRVNSRQAI